MITKLIRDDLSCFTPYENAKIASDEETIRLNANESPWSVGDSRLNRYPQQVANQRLAEFYQVDAEQVLVTRGSDEGIDLLVRLFCTVGRDEVLTLNPTFGMYQMAAQLQGVKVNTVELRSDQDFTIDVDAILAAITPTTKLVFICSPNNPTGNVIDLSSMRKLCKQTAERCIIVVDEAYVEFADRESFSSLLGEYSNLIVLRTLSKAFGLAGVRVGIVLANQLIIQWLRAIMTPYPIPTPCRVLIDEALQLSRIMRMWVNVAMLKRSRQLLKLSLEKLNFIERVYPSKANFLLVKMNHADKLTHFAATRGLLLRCFSKSTDLLRISVGSEAENQRLLQILTEWVKRDEK